jgi:hypothetical protein
MGHAKYGGLAPKKLVAATLTPRGTLSVWRCEQQIRVRGNADDNNQSDLFWDDAGVDAKLDFARVSSVARGSCTPYRSRRPAAKLIFVARIRV